MELRSERVLLRELRDDDFETTHAYGSNPEVVRYMAWGPNSPDDTRDFFRREGLQRRDTLIRGEWRDSLIYARVADE